MIVVLPFCAADTAAAGRLLEWIRDLGGAKTFRVLLVADAGVHWGHAVELAQLAEQVFAKVNLITNGESVIDWIKGPASLFYEAARWIETSNPQPWLWLETDCVPLRANWLDLIEAEYRQQKKPFMGVVYEKSPTDSPSLPQVNFSGVAVYPGDAWTRLQQFKDSPLNFDIAFNPAVVPEAAHTGLIQHFWGQPNLPPTFAEWKTPASPINTFQLSNLQAGAVLFHRNKDGTLIELLRRKHFAESNRAVVVLPFCSKDFRLMASHVRWAGELGGCKLDDALLAYDPSVDGQMVIEVVKAAASVYRNVWAHVYPVPPAGDVTIAARWAFSCVADFMQREVGRPWLWMEADMVPLKPGWLDSLQLLYRNCGKPFFGSIIPEMGHMNGTAFYPPETATWCPSIRKSEFDAFDTGMRDEQRAAGVFDASNYMQHAWVMREGRCFPHGHGEVPSFRSTLDVTNNITPTALTFHRVKDTTLADRLREMRK